MSIDDPGWGGDSFGGGTGGSGGAGGGGWGSPDDKPPRGGLNWRSPAVLGGGAALVVIVIVVVLVLSLSGGNKPKKTADVTTPTPTTSTTASKPATTSSSAKPTPSTTPPPTLAEYNTMADAVCTSFKARVTAAENASPQSAALSQTYTVVTEELAAIKKVPYPSTQKAQVQLWYQQIETALNDIKTNNLNAINPAITTADTTAGNLGMHVCNYGY